MDLTWYLNRLGRMSLAELVYRVQQRVEAQLQKAGLFTARHVPMPDLKRTSQPWNFAGAHFDSAPYVAAAERILEGRLEVFALDDAPLGHPPVWNRDPRTGTVAPLTFGKTLNYRDETLAGDIKYLWEPSRHLHLVTLAQAYYLTGEPRYVAGLQRHLHSWWDACPYLMGPQWTSSLELAIRLINWSWVWHLLGGLNGPVLGSAAHRELRHRWLTSIYQHAHFIRGHFSRYSSANNHLIGEAAGLFVAAVTWPHWPESERWRDEAFAVLADEALRQNTADGVNREQTTSYQQFVLDFLLLAALCGQANGIEFPPRYRERLERMLEFIAAVRDAGGHVPMIGDADDGFVVRLAPQSDHCPFQSLLATGAVLFEREDFKVAAAHCDDKTRWLLGAAGEAGFAQLDTSGSRGRTRSFPEGGYYVLGGDFNSPNETLLVVDAGPLGYLSLAAHGHADALAFTLSLGGNEFLVDPGTFAYHTQKVWRDYFRGTSAHNTLRVDGADQSLLGGNFMWTHHANAHCELSTSSDATDRFVGSHDGYARLADPAIHRRAIAWEKSNGVIVVEDTLACAQAHTVEQFWHFAEDVAVQLDGHTVQATKAGWSLTLELDPSWSEVASVRGREAPPLGWISRRFDVKVPTATVVCSGATQGHTLWTTKLRINRSA